jgi:hypothetical protein
MMMQASSCLVVKFMLVSMLVKFMQVKFILVGSMLARLCPIRK